MQTFERFLAWTGRDEVCVETIELVPDLQRRGTPALGGYDAVDRRIELDAGQDDLVTTTLHELCHALDHAERRSLNALDAFTLSREHPEFTRRGPQSRRREAFALACERGPLGVSVAESLLRQCAPGSRPEGLRRVLDEVFVHGPRHRDVPADYSTGAWRPPVGWSVVEPLTVLWSAAGDVAIGVERDGDEGLWVVDMATGETREQPRGPLTRDLQSVRPSLPGWAVLDATPPRPEGQWLATGGGLPWGDLVFGVVLADDDGVHLPTSPCSSLDARFVPAPDAVFRVVARGTEVGWQRWAVEER